MGRWNVVSVCVWGGGGTLCQEVHVHGKVECCKCVCGGGGGGTLCQEVHVHGTVGLG